jgi:pimeloyl-ACP methyl ester carboxylesterase
VRPDLVRGLVLMDGGLPMPPAASVDPSSLLPGIGERRYRAFRSDPVAARDSLRPYYADLEALPAADRDFLAARVQERVGSETQLRAYFSLFRSLALTILLGQRGYAARLAASSLPLCLVWGGKDAVVPVAALDLLSKTAPRAKAGVIEGAGHLPHQERPAATAQAIREFLEVADGKAPR